MHQRNSIFLFFVVLLLGLLFMSITGSEEQPATSSITLDQYSIMKPVQYKNLQVFVIIGKAATKIE